MSSPNSSSAVPPLPHHGSGKREVNWLYMTPLFLMAIPLLRHSVRNDPAKSRKLVAGAIGIGLLHGTWLIMKAGEEAEPVLKDQGFVSPAKLEEMRRKQAEVGGARGAAAPAPAANQLR